MNKLDCIFFSIWGKYNAYDSQPVLDVFYAASLAITLHAELSGMLYCYRSCLFAMGGWAGGHSVFLALWVCYHNNSKLRASIFTRLGLYVKVVTISS